MTKRLGKLPARIDARTFKLQAYAAALPSAPEKCDRTASITNLGTMANDSIGDCTCAAAGHMIQAWTAEDGSQVIIPDESIINMYEAVSGYRPDNPTSDNGAIVLDVLNNWRKAGLDGHRLGAYAALRLKNRAEVKQAIYYFGGAYTGLLLPLSAQSQKLWSLTPQGLEGTGAPASWGGHAVPLVAYDEIGPICITWGSYMQMTWEFYDAYCEEAYACFSTDIVGADDKSPEGFNAAQLQSDLQKIAA